MENSNSRPTPKVIFVLGPPGSGKGTLCKSIVENYGYEHLSAGDLLRAERADPQSQYGELIETYIKEGKIVPVEITCKLIQNAMLKSKQDKFLIDGFPRNQDNVDGWNNKVAAHVDLQFVLFIECPLEVCTQRCLKRGASSGRTDDNIESLKKRFVTYETETKPILEFYKAQNLVKFLDGTKRPQVVFDDFKKFLE